jgi:hypothetical protein
VPRCGQIGDSARVPTPAPDHDVIDTEIPLCHDFLQITQAKPISEIPAHAHDDDLGFEMALLEHRWLAPSHARESVSDSSNRYATHPCYVIRSCLQRSMRARAIFLHHHFFEIKPARGCYRQYGGQSSNRSNHGTRRTGARVLPNEYSSGIGRTNTVNIRSATRPCANEMAKPTLSPALCWCSRERCMAKSTNRTGPSRVKAGRKLL